MHIKEQRALIAAVRADDVGRTGRDEVGLGMAAKYPKIKLAAEQVKPQKGKRKVNDAEAVTDRKVGVERREWRRNAEGKTMQEERRYEKTDEQGG